MARTMRKLWATLLAFALVLSGVSIVGPAVTGTDTIYAAKTVYYVKATKLEVHKKASESSKVVKTLKQGKKVVKAGQIDDNGWVKIRYADEKYGYAKRDDLTTKKEKATSKTTTTTTASELEKIGKDEYNKIVKTAKDNNWKVTFKTWDYGPSQQSPDVYNAYSSVRLSNSSYRCGIRGHGCSIFTPTGMRYDMYIYQKDHTTKIDGVIGQTIAEIIPKIKQYAD